MSAGIDSQRWRAGLGKNGQGLIVMDESTQRRASFKSSSNCCSRSGDAMNPNRVKKHAASSSMGWVSIALIPAFSAINILLPIPYPNPGEEARCFFIDGMGQHSPDTGLLGNQHRAANRVLQQAKADALPLIRH